MFHVNCMHALGVNQSMCHRNPHMARMSYTKKLNKSDNHDHSQQPHHCHPLSCLLPCFWGSPSVSYKQTTKPQVSHCSLSTTTCSHHFPPKHWLSLLPNKASTQPTTNNHNNNDASDDDNDEALTPLCHTNCQTTAITAEY